MDGLFQFSWPVGVFIKHSTKKTISFVASCYNPTSTYYLKVETVVQGYSDSWNASIVCIAPSQSCEDKSYQILVSSSTQSFAQKRNDFLDKVSYALNKGNSLSAVRNATLQAVQYNNYQIIDTMMFKGTIDRQSFISAYNNARAGFLQANSFIQQTPQYFSCQTCGASAVDWTNYIFDNFTSINSSRYYPPAEEVNPSTGKLEPICGSRGNQVKLLGCVAITGVTTGGLGAVLGGWGCWCNFCTRNSWLGTKICAN